MHGYRVVADTATNVHRRRSWERALYARIRVTGHRSVIWVLTPTFWAVSLIEVVSLLAKPRLDGADHATIVLVVAVSLATLPLLNCGQRTASYLLAATILLLPWATMVSQREVGDPVEHLSKAIYVVLLPVAAAGLWSAPRARGMVVVVTVDVTAVLAVAYWTGQLPPKFAADLMILAGAVGLLVHWSANQSDHKDIDGLTDLPTQARLRRDLDHRQQNPAAMSASVGERLLLMDIDDLAGTNTAHGYACGDDMLFETARGLTTALPDGSSLYHLGAGTFAARVPDNDLTNSDISVTAARSVPADTTASVGLAVIGPGESTRGLLARAESSLLRAKTQGPGGIDPRIDEQWMIREMLVGIDLNQFHVLYQPIVDLEDGTTVGSEALVRWNHPQHGRIGPDQFIPLAEETGFITILGRHVLTTACAEAAAAEHAGHRLDRVNVNVSPVELADPGYANQVLNILTSTGLSPHRLVLELTESTLTNGNTTAERTLTALRQHGIRVAIDDFGTGHSSLSRLARLPIDILKIDKSFVWANPDDGRDHLLSAIVALARSFHLSTVSEGIETWDQAELLAGHGCRYAQGYLFGRPGPYADLLVTPVNSQRRHGPPPTDHESGLVRGMSDLA